MNQGAVVSLAVLGVAVLAGLFIYAAVRGGSVWRKKMDAMLLPIGFASCQDAEARASLAKRLLMVNTRHRGKRLLMGAYRRPSPQGDFDIYVCDYRFASASGHASGASWILVCLVSNVLHLPRFTIESVPENAGTAGRLFDALADSLDRPGMDKFDVEASRLDKRFHVYVEARQKDRFQTFAKSLTLALQDNKGVCVEAGGDALILTSIPMIADQVRQDIDSRKLLGLIHLATSLYEILSVG